MKNRFSLEKTLINGVYKIKYKQLKDNRGYFQRLFCSKLFKKLKLPTKIVNINNSLSKKKGTVRGLHYQINPFQEDKIIKCIKGSVDNYILDLRKKSKTYKKLVRINLSEKKNYMSLIPKGCANGIQTLKNNTEIIYFTTNFYSNKHERGVNILDKKLNIKFRTNITVMSKKDKNWKKL